MSNKKKNLHEPVRAINAEIKSVKREKHQEKEKIQGDGIVKWIFGILVALAVVYMVWSTYVVG